MGQSLDLQLDYRRVGSIIAVVLDLFSRRVMSWSMQSRMSEELVTDALVMALWRRRPGQDLLHNSDQASQ